MTDDNDVERLKARLDELEAENDALKSTETVPPVRSHHRVRFSVAVAMVVVASLLVPVSILGVWLRNQVSNTDRYVETMAPLARDPAIQAAATNRITNTIFSSIDVEAEVKEVLPDRAQVLAAPISGGLETLVRNIVDRVVTSDRFATLWDDANRIAHSQVVDVLEAEKAPRGAVVIDLSGIAKVATDRLNSAGVSFFDRFDPGSRNLEITVFQSDEIANVQDAFRLFDRVATVMPWIAILLLIGAVFVFPNRRRGVIWAASGLAIGAFVVLLGLTIGRSFYLSALPSSVSQPAAESAFDTLTRFVRAGTRTVVAVGLVIMLVAVMAGPSRLAVSLRGFVARATGRLGDEADSHGADLGPVGAFVSQNINALRIAVAVMAGIVFIAWTAPTGMTVLWIAIVSVLALVVLEVLARIGSAAADRSTPEPPAGTSGPPVTPAST